MQVGLRYALNDRDRAPTCASEDVYYQTFDERQIHAILFKPVFATTGAKAGVIYAHGGPSGQTTKAGSVEITMLCNLGYTIFAPNVRGSTGYGQAFEDLNNGDWGGGDANDYEWARRFLAVSEGIEAARIGIMGGSYGGYMTNWAVTRPDNRFAFGISDFGMADLLYQVSGSVVAGNTTSDMGDPVANAELYRDRSPMTWTQYLSVPLLLTHGSRDFRTLVEDTRRFYADLKGRGKDVTFVELEGEGHGYKYLDTRAIYFQAVLDFLWLHAPVE